MLTSWIEAVDKLKAGSVGILPTETVYGLAAVALDASACARIFDIKERPRFNPLIVHVADKESLLALAQSIPRPAIKLIDKFMPGPLTLVLPKRKEISDLVTASMPHVALRIPSHPVMQKILSELKLPVAAPSANRFQCLSPTSIEQLDPNVVKKVDFVVDGGQCLLGVESTIIGFENDKPVLYRPGSLPIEDLEQCLGRPVLKPEGLAVKAPGMLKKHYAPRTPLSLWRGIAPTPISNNCALVRFQMQTPISSFAWEGSLSLDGDLLEAASNLFKTLSKLDSKRFDLIYVELAPDYGLGKTINDRLKRASI